MEVTKLNIFKQGLPLTVIDNLAICFKKPQIELYLRLINLISVLHNCQ